MSSKRRQTGSEGAIDSSFSATSTPSPFKRVKPGSTAPKHHDSGYSDEDCLSQPSKKVRLLAQVKREAQGYSPPAHKLVAKSKRRTSSDGPVSRSSLIPRGERKRATVGQIDESVLRMVCDDSATGEVKELHYRNMLHSTIDWNNAEHINKINNWRNQIYGRAGLKAKTVTVWLDEEELWFELYHQLSIAESRTRGILLPSTFAIREAFNNTFDGQVLQYKGKALEPRGERQPNAFASKFNRMCPQLRARSYMCTWGKSGDVYVPKITFGMLKKYQRMRQEMERKGLKDESAYSEGLEEWLYLFSHLPDSEDDDVQEEYRPAEEVDAAAALISFATQAFGGKKVVKIEDDQASSPLQQLYEAPSISSRALPELSKSSSFTDSKDAVGSHASLTSAKIGSFTGTGKENIVPPADGVLSNIERSGCRTPVGKVEFDYSHLMMSPD